MESPTKPRLRVLDASLKGRIAQARRPLLFLDYDGTLRSYVTDPTAAAPDARTLHVLEALAQRAIVYVVSGRDENTLDRWLGRLPVGLVAEHGLMLREPGHERPWQQRVELGNSELDTLVRPLFEEFTQRTPGSSIESKRSAIVWHYRASEAEYAARQALELCARLDELLKQRPYDVLRGACLIEVRHDHVTKREAVADLLERHRTSDFVFCAGDDRTDEDMMRAITEPWRSRTVTCWVGRENPWAEYWSDSTGALLSELEAMVSLWNQADPAPSR